MKRLSVKLFLFLIIGLLLANCSDRDRSNPLDPKNPETEGRPVGVRIYSEFNRIYLNWNVIRLNNLAGYNIYRKTALDTAFIHRARCEPESWEYIDYDVKYETQYTYQITAVGEDFESPPSDSVSIVPGPTIIWATDADNQRIIKISHDGIHTIRNSSVVGFPWDIELTGRGDSYWYSDLFYGNIYRVQDSELDRYVSNTGYPDPVDIEFDYRRNVLWGANENGSIIRISPVMVDSMQEIEDVEIISPASVSVSDVDGDCWVADPGSEQVYRIDASGQLIKVLQEKFNNPTDIVYNDGDHTVWVADSSRVLHLSFEGDYFDEIAFSFVNATKLSVNPESGDIWVIDHGAQVGDAKILRFDAQRNLMTEVTGFTAPLNLTVNLYDNGCIVVDSGAGKIVRLTADGEIIGESDGYYYPYGLAIEYY